MCTKYSRPASPYITVHHGGCLDCRAQLLHGPRWCGCCRYHSSNGWGAPDMSIKDKQFFLTKSIPLDDRLAAINDKAADLRHELLSLPFDHKMGVEVHEHLEHLQRLVRECIAGAKDKETPR